MSITRSVSLTRKYLLPAALLLLGGCSSLQYYGQSIQGHLDLMERRQPIDQLLVDPGIAVELRDQLQTAIGIRAFASAELGLPFNRSYRSYADLERDYVVWNVIATPALSVEPLQWCYLLVGCLQYRGYFNETAARKLAEELRSDGHDVTIGGAIAYSTLGWFHDPVLNTMLQRGDIFLARVIFHELAHQQLFFPGDTAFNEAFADAVALAGVERWLRAHGRATDLQNFRLEQSYEQDFVALVLKYRHKLQQLYDSGKSEADMLRVKPSLFDQMRIDYRQLRATWNGHTAYDRWFEQELNNAHLAAVVTYHELLPDFARLLESVGGDLPRFYDRVAGLADCSPAKRRQWLARMAVATAMPTATGCY